ncbi:hypothetical protein [Pseudomonas rubra]|uniref:Uncharacterized protein n=1 Tax=Pseudomonas rubra TaxID=2942627 RepID=A0ABT5PFI1_9PSED|nr:hypothetical protein [Pseudomonas rubra]MDD1017075.1 hypothetical protein [Pseudomonas rubra]MDD1036644.1 hypothetical protein [Pseudomonas rubra]MDD1156006.1 hypothetical protein [Pseudomonas rubra]
MPADLLSQQGVYRVIGPEQQEWLLLMTPVQPEPDGRHVLQALLHREREPLFEERTLGNIFIHNGLSAPSFIAQVFASSDSGGDSAGLGFLGFGGGDGGGFGTSTFAGLFAREAAQEGESMRVFDGKQWRTTDPAQGLRAVFGAASLEQQLQNIKDAEQRPVRELAMALAQPTQIGNPQGHAALAAGP